MPSVRLRSIGRKLKPSARTKVRVPEKKAESFYLSPEWRALCEQIKTERWPHLLATRGHCCEDGECRATHSRRTRIFFDHLKERRDHPELALAKANIIGRCGASHSRKTASARAQRYDQQRKG
jgi:5-methylcytosine-specific restriction enzyme A